MPVTTYTQFRSVLTRPFLACTHPGVAPEFTHDLPRCHIPQHHCLVPAAGAETAVVKGAREQSREDQRLPLIPASAPRSRSGPRLTLPRPAPRSRGRCTSAVASLAAGSTASGSCRCRKSDSNCHPLGNTTRGLLGRRLQEAEVGPGMTIRALTIKSHGSHRPLPAVQRLQQLPRQLRAPRFWLRESHCSALPSSPPYSSLHRGFLPWEPTLWCNLIIVLHSLLPISHFRVQRLGFLEKALETLKLVSSVSVSFPTSCFLGTFLASSNSLSPGWGEFQLPPAGTEARGQRVLL